MRWGETKNCCLRNSPDSCLLPIEGSGIHTNQEGSKQAIIYFTKVLEKAPQEYLIQPSMFESDEPFPKFVNVAPKLGLNTFDLLGEAIVDDFTGDGYLDIVVSTFDLKEQMHFFRNNRDGTFTDVAPQRGATGPRRSFPIWFWDFDNDGVLDIYV